MHFPFAMAIKDHTLLVSSQDSDGKYSYGRLVALDTQVINNALKNLKADNALDWQPALKSNVLIPPDAGLISFEDQIIFASRADNQLYTAAEPLCNEPSQVINNCPNNTTLKLSENDPYALAILEQNPNRDVILASYLSSGRIDLIELDKKPSKPVLKPLKNFLIQDWVGEKFKGDFFIKKVSVTQASKPDQAQVFLLVERKVSKEYIHDLAERKSTFKLALLQKNTGALLVSVKVKDLLDKDKIDVADIKIRNLQENFGIYLAQDFYINEKDNTAVILARSPENLIKIGLAQESLLERQLVCRGSSSMAVSRKLDRIFVPCFSDNRIISFTLSSLALMAASDHHGRGPAFAVIDEKHETVFVSFNTEGKVGIFDFDLGYLGHLFQPAPINRVGS